LVWHLRRFGDSSSATVAKFGSKHELKKTKPWLQ